MREVGILAILKLCLKKLLLEAYRLISFKKRELHPFDLKYGTDTGGIIEPGTLDIPDEKVAHAVRYQTAIVEVFLDILNSLPIAYEEFQFIDMGSGKGRALLLASQFPFKKIIGIELSENLHKIACKNIELYKDDRQQCRQIQSLCRDAAMHKILDEKIVFYFFNPFDEQVMRSVLINIESSLNKKNRDIFIAYLKPVYRYLFDESPLFKILKETERYLIYKSKVKLDDNEK